MGYLGMKRGREGKADTIISIANCLMLLSHTNEFDSVKSDSPSRVFECKTCNRKFPSFQALGGHRASHKKPRLIESELTQGSPVKPKTHECSVCGLEFAMGQALGGHMRRHRVNATSDTESSELTQSPWRLPSMKRNSENSEMGMCLDLNLTPMENVDLDFQLGKVTPTVHYFL